MTVGLRAERICVVPWTHAPNVVVRGTVEVTEPVGAEVYAYVRVGPHLLAARSKVETAAIARGAVMDWYADASAVKLFDPDSGVNLFDGEEP